jgi:hypothetical protein
MLQSRRTRDTGLRSRGREPMVATDSDLMESSLIAVADAGVELRHPLFARWFAAWPERRATFINADASSRRMTDETLGMMLGLANEEEFWVWPQLAELVHNHEGYGHFGVAEYESWIDLTIEVLGELARAAWNAEVEAAWVRQGERLKILIQAAREGWDRTMPGHILGSINVK